MASGGFLDENLGRAAMSEIRALAEQTTPLESPGTGRTPPEVTVAVSSMQLSATAARLCVSASGQASPYFALIRARFLSRLACQRPRSAKVPRRVALDCVFSAQE